jgi:hypothetical protein
VQGLGVFFPLDHIDGLTALNGSQHLGQVIENGLHPLQVPDPPARVLRVRAPLPEGLRSQTHGLMHQHPLRIDIVVGRDDAAMPVAMGCAVDKEIPPAQAQRRQNGIQGTLRMAIEEDFVGGWCNTEARRMIVMGRAAGLPLVPVRPGLRAAVRDRGSQGRGIGAGRESCIH